MLWTRALSLLAACLAHLGLLLLLLHAQRHRQQDAGVQSYMVWLRLQAPDRQVLRDAAAADSRTPFRRPRAPPATLPPPQAPVDRQDSTAITPSERPIDWSAEATRSAANVVQQQADAQSRPSLQSSPRVLPLPPTSAAVQPGETQRFAGGEVITWVNGRCFYRVPRSEAWQPGSPGLFLPVCKKKYPARYLQPREPGGLGDQ
jgi:hypothetical protein